MYFILHSVSPLLHQVSAVVSCATVLQDVGVLYIRRVLWEHVLPASAQNHLESHKNRIKEITILVIAVLLLLLK